MVTTLLAGGLSCSCPPYQGNTAMRALRETLTRRPRTRAGSYEEEGDQDTVEQVSTSKMA